MRTSNQERIAALTTAGRWGTDTLHSLLASHAAAQPDHLAVKDQPDRQQLTGDAPRSLSWVELDRASDHLAAQLVAAGLTEDDRIIIQLPNIVELLVSYYAISKMGAIASPVPVQYGSHELQHMASALGAAAIISIGYFRKTACCALFPWSTCRHWEALFSLQR